MMCPNNIRISCGLARPRCRTTWMARRKRLHLFCLTRKYRPPANSKPKNSPEVEPLESSCTGSPNSSQTADFVARFHDQVLVGAEDSKVIHIPGCEKILSITETGASLAVNDVLVIGKSGLLHGVDKGGLAKVECPIPPHWQHAKFGEDELVARNSRAVNREKVEVLGFDRGKGEQVAECLRDSNIVKGTLNIPSGQVVNLGTTFNTGERAGGRESRGRGVDEQSVCDSGVENEPKLPVAFRNKENAKTGGPSSCSPPADHAGGVQPM